IRDRNVTGVQTCALPIYTNHTESQYQTIVKVSGTFRPAARNGHLYSQCKFAVFEDETAEKSLRHSCRSALTRQGITLPSDGDSYHRRLLGLKLSASQQESC